VLCVWWVIIWILLVVSVLWGVASCVARPMGGTLGFSYVVVIKQLALWLHFHTGECELRYTGGESHWCLSVCCVLNGCVITRPVIMICCSCSRRRTGDAQTAGCHGMLGW
jgi:hypothetical protein